MSQQEKNGDTMQFDKPKRASGAEKARRAKKRKQQLFNRTFLYAMMVIVASLLLAVYALHVANDALALMNPSSDLSVRIEKGSTVGQIARELKDAGLIEYRWAFVLFAKVTGNADSFQYGTYVLNTDMDYLELVTNLQKTASFRATVTVMIPEGAELREIIATLDEKNVCSAEELWEHGVAAESPFSGLLSFADATGLWGLSESALPILEVLEEVVVFDYDFLQNLPERENRLEGYLFPDTYEFFEQSDAVTVLTKFLDNFEVKFSQELRDRAEEIGMSIDEVVTLASIIEREAASDEDRATVSSVFHNRLNSTQYPLLQSCATVQYVLQERKSVLTYDDIKIDSPYNTYLYEGLPIGPIASPGLASIKAALYPETTDYYFFVVSADGTHIFSKTLAEHNAAVKQANSSRGTGAVSG